jgi:hypothetical protein
VPQETIMNEAEDAQTIDSAVKAVARLKKHAHLEDWYAIGAGFWVGVRIAVEKHKPNDRATDKRYQNEFGAWLREHPWTLDIDKASRNHAIWLHEYRDEVEKFLDTVTENKRANMNHPSTVRRAFDKMNIIPEPKPDREPKAQITQAEHEALIAERNALKQRLDDADWSPPDTPLDIPKEFEAMKSDLELHIDKLHAREQELDAANLEIARLRNRVAELEGKPPKPTKSARPPAPTNTGFAHITLAQPSNKFKLNTRSGIPFDPKKHHQLIDAVLARGEFDYTLDKPELMSDEGKRIHRILTTLDLHGLRAQREREGNPT